MKKLFLSILGFFAFANHANALTPDQWNYIPFSSYTEVATPSFMMFSSATLLWVGVTISSPASGSYLTIARSTTPVWTPDVSTSAMITTDYLVTNAGPIYLDLFGMKSASFTYINKVGTAKLIMWYQCIKRKETDAGLCPGMGATGFSSNGALH